VDTIATKRHRRLVELLIAERKRAGIRQAELARRVGKTQTFVARIEAGQRRVDAIELLSLCRIIGVDPIRVVRKVLKIEDELWRPSGRSREIGHDGRHPPVARAAVARWCRSGLDQEVGGLALQRPRQFLKPVGRDVCATVLIVLDGADRDADRSGDLGLRDVAVFADLMKALTGSMVGLVHGLHLFWCSAPLVRRDKAQVAGYNHSKKLSFLA
jgi:transcriptional regulator with XRE-family HTH domain